MNNYSNNNLLIKKTIVFIAILLIIILYLINLRNLNLLNNSGVWVAFLLNLSVVILSLIFNGIDFITLFIICLNMLLFPIIIQYLLGRSYGDLQANIVSLHIPQLLSYNYAYCVTFLCLSILFNFKKNEVSIINVPLGSYSDFAISFNNFIAIVFTFVAFPRLGFSINNINERFDMLLPGHAWNQLAIVALIFNLPYLREKKSVQFTYLFVFSWFLLNGERADITGLIFGLALLYFMKTINERDNLKTICLIFLLFIFVTLLNLIASWRGGESLTVAESIRKLLVTPTTSDVAYLYNISIDILNRFGISHGKVLFANITSAIPFATPIDFSTIVTNLGYLNPGGEPLLAEPIVDFGTYGIFLISRNVNLS